MFLLFLATLACGSSINMLQGNIVSIKGYTKLRSSNASSLYQMNLNGDHSYQWAPLLVDLHGSRRQIGYDYAALLHSEANDTLRSFMADIIRKPSERLLFETFVDYAWKHWLAPHTPAGFHEELAGMDDWAAANPAASRGEEKTSVVAHRFYTLANLPADPINIQHMLENEFEQGWPDWLKGAVNDLIRILERIIHTCDAYGVWGSRTSENGAVFSSRNLDYQSNTGINRHKLVVVYHIDNVQPYASIGFTFGLGALAGLSRHTTVSEMNLDSSNVIFEGVPFPLRLRMVLEQATDLQSALAVWNATNNTNSFNFLIASSVDNAAVALETMQGYTGVFGANSPVEAAAFYDCGKPPNVDPTCHKWTTQTGKVRIGFPLPEVVWRSNHGFNPSIMSFQEPLFNNTIFRYNLMHDIFQQLQAEGLKIDDQTAVNIVASLGIKGPNYLTCDQKFDGDNVMSIAYMPRGPGGNTRAYIAWEAKSGAQWTPAACASYVALDLEKWFSN